KLAHGEPTPTREFIPEVAEALGAPKPLHIPAWLGRLLAGDVAVTMMTEGRGSADSEGTRGDGRDLRRLLSPPEPGRPGGDAAAEEVDEGVFPLDRRALAEGGTTVDSPKAYLS